MNYIQDEYERMLREVPQIQELPEIEDVRRAFFIGAMFGANAAAAGRGQEIAREFLEFFSKMTDELMDEITKFKETL